MKKTFLALPVLALLTVQPAQAAGCLKGALLGGIAGHFVGKHAIAGAIAGCAMGRIAADPKVQQNSSGLLGKLKEKLKASGQSADDALGVQPTTP